MLLTFYVAGLVTGWCFPVHRRRKPPSGPETPEQSLSRLSGGYRGTRPSTALSPPRPVRSANMPMKGGFPPGMPLTGPPQGSGESRPFGPPGMPKGSGFAPGPQPRVRPTRPADMPTQGTTGGAGQAYGGPVLPEHTVWR